MFHRIAIASSARARLVRLLRTGCVAGALLSGVHIGAQRLAAQPYHYVPEHRRPVDATIQHLKNIAAHNTYSGREMERYDAAMTHLSQFAQRLHEGVFDTGKLDRGISDVKSVLNKNPMDGRARDILNRDVLELRRLRAEYRIGYRYRP